MLNSKPLIHRVIIHTNDLEDSKWRAYTRQFEGVGGLLTELDSEESPLSKAHVPHRREKLEMVRSMQ